MLGPSQESQESSNESELLFKFNELKEALKTDYSFHFQMKNGIFIAQSQMEYDKYLSMKKKVNVF